MNKIWAIAYKDTLSDPADQSGNRIDLETTLVDGTADQNINPLAYFAPSMAILFLMFTIITRGLGVQAVLPEAIMLLAFGGIYLSIGVWRFRYE